METVYKLETFTVKLAVAERELGACRSSEDAAALMRPVYAQLDADIEHFSVLFLNNKNRLRGYKVVSSGTLTASLVHPREVYRAVCLYGAAAVVFVHNHPSGDPAPSSEDIGLTRRLKEVGDVMGVRVLDHIVLGDGRSFSFSDHGMLEGGPDTSAASAAAWRAAHGIPPIGSPTGKGGRFRAPYKDRKAKRKDAGIPRGPRIKQAVVPEPPAAS